MDLPVTTTGRYAVGELNKLFMFHYKKSLLRFDGVVVWVVEEFFENVVKRALVFLGFIGHREAL